MKPKISPQMKLASIGLVFCIFLTGCASKQMKLTRTGFLSNYDDLKEDEGSEGMYVYENSDVNIKDRYSKIMIAPVQFKLDPKIKEHQMTFADREKLSVYFDQKLREGLTGNYDIVYEPGPDVIIIRTAITDILPNKVYLNLHWSTTLLGGGIGGASLEAEMVDSLTGERILAFVDERKGKTFLQDPKHLISNYTSGLTKWGHTKEVLGIWAEMMVMNLNQLRDKYVGRKAQARIGAP